MLSEFFKFIFFTQKIVSFLRHVCGCVRDRGRELKGLCVSFTGSMPLRTP